MPRRTVTDLIARYSLEPTLRDIYVEGAFDERLLRQLFRYIKCDRPSIFRIDLIDISDDLLQKHNQTRGEKGEVVALALELFSYFGSISSVTCVVDADCDRLLNVLPTNPILFATDFTSMDMYWLIDDTVSRFFTSIGQHVWTKETLIVDIGATATDLFLIRAANQSLDLRFGMIPFKKYCSRTTCTVSFDTKAYCKSALVSAGKGSCSERLDSEIERLRPSLDADLRNRAHGHDLVELIFSAYRERLGSLGIKEAKAVETLISMTLPVDDLLSHELFRTIVERNC